LPPLAWETFFLKEVVIRLSNVVVNKLKETSIEPIIVFEIDGVETLYSSALLKKVARYGDENLFYGDTPFVYGGLVPLLNQENLIALEGTTTSIKQSLSPDKARGTGITSMSIALVDKNGKATRLATGSEGELLFRRCKVWVGFGESSSFREDFILVFRGVIESIKTEQAKVKFMLSSPDQKRKSLLIPKGDTELNGAITNSQTTITLDSTENFFIVPDHPAYSPKDESLKSYVKIEDEIIQYSGISGNQLTGCVRGQLGTVAVVHDDDAQAETFFLLEGNAMELALKVMLSSKDQDSYAELDATSVNTSPNGIINNSFYFGGIDVEREYNIRSGDFVKTSGFDSAGNNFSSWREILVVQVFDTGTVIIVDQTLTTEASSIGSVEFLSRFNTLGSLGLSMFPDEVDIEKHEFLRGNFLFNFDYRFFLKDEIENGKEWIEAELYRPASCYSLPADRPGLSRLSVGMHIAPLPNESIVTLSQNNIVRPDSIAVTRSVNKNYYNSILTKYNDTPLEDEFFRKIFVLSGTQALPAFKGNKTLILESKGLRDDLSGDTLALASNTRLLKRYQSAAEYIESLEIKFSAGVQVNVGDIIILNPEGLNISNPASNDRFRKSGLWEVVNKSIDLKGKASVDLVNTAFNIDARYGLWSQASRVRTVLSQSSFVIEPTSAFPKFGAANEWRKWNQITGLGVKLRVSDWSDEFEVKLQSVSFNTLTLSEPCPFPILPGMILELCSYSFSGITTEQKLIYAHWTDDDNNFADGGLPYVWI